MVSSLSWWYFQSHREYNARRCPSTGVLYSQRSFAVGQSSQHPLCIFVELSPSLIAGHEGVDGSQSSERIDFSMALFKAAWVDNRDIAKADVLAEIFGQRASQILNETQNPMSKTPSKR